MKHPAKLRYKTLYIHENNTQGIEKKPNTLGLIRNQEEKTEQRSSRIKQC